jgi:Na+/H+ antiporter NhaC
MGSLETASGIQKEREIAMLHQLCRIATSYKFIAFFISAILILLPEFNLLGQEMSISAENASGGLHLDKESMKLIYKSGMSEKHLPLWLSVMPPLIAIMLALIFREVHIALFAGIWFGVFTINGLEFSNLFSSLFRIADTYLLEAIAPADGDTGHVSIIVFSLLIGGMVAIISGNGGMQSIVTHVTRIATNARRSQLATWLMGVIIFFDDYANTLVVGNTMRPLTDKYKISREKLAYIVDSTAAPVATVALVTTWIGFQLSQIAKGIEVQEFISNDISIYGLFLGSLQYAFYPFLTLLFVLMLIITGRDFGPMLKAERETRQNSQKTEKTDTKTAHSAAWLNAAIPILVLVGVVVAGIFITGRISTFEGMTISEIAAWTNHQHFFKKIQTFVSNADSYKALLWGSVASCIVAVLISVGTKALSVKESMELLIEGLKSMLPAVVILVLAWSLAAVIDELYTSTFIISIIPENANVLWLPAVIFIVSAAVAFSTGSSWSTMAIMYPICIPLVLGLATQEGSVTDSHLFMPVLLNTISVILCASVLGDHCSPISDTTILSSLSADCDHISHVRTQLPYALTVGAVSLFCGCILFAWGVPWYIGYVIGITMLILVVKFIGKAL